MCVCVCLSPCLNIFTFVGSYIQPVIQSMFTNQEHEAKYDMTLALKSLNFKGMLV